MHPKPPAHETELDSRELQVRFSSQVKDAFRLLCVVASKSTQFDSEMVDTLKAWSGSEPVNVHEVMVSLPLIAEQMAEHIIATNDAAAKDAWREICMQMPEDGFSVSQSRQRKR